MVDFLKELLNDVSKIAEPLGNLFGKADKAMTNVNKIRLSSLKNNCHIEKNSISKRISQRVCQKIKKSIIYKLINYIFPQKKSQSLKELKTTYTKNRENIKNINSDEKETIKKLKAEL